MGKAEETETTQREEQDIHKEKKSNVIEKEERIRKADLSEEDDRREKKKRKRERQKEKKRAEKEANMTEKEKVQKVKEATLSEIERVEIEKGTFQKIAYLREEGERREKNERKRAEKEASLTTQVCGVEYKGSVLPTSAELNQLTIKSYSAAREKEKTQEMSSHSKLEIVLGPSLTNYCKVIHLMPLFHLSFFLSPFLFLIPSLSFSLLLMAYYSIAH